MDYEVYIYHPYLLGKARNSQPCSSCGLASFQSSLPFGLRDILKMYTALAFAKLAPYIHKTLSPVSRPGTLRCTADPDPAIPSAVALGQKGKILFRLHDIKEEGSIFIKELVSGFSEEQIVLSFSGGKDSTVTADLVAKSLGNPSLMHIFGDTTLKKYVISITD